jgi:hypothetical protein
MFIDMGQADRSLYRNPRAEQPRLPWVMAINMAAKKMGYGHFLDVPDARVGELHSTARGIQVAQSKE